MLKIWRTSASRSISRKTGSAANHQLGHLLDGLVDDVVVKHADASGVRLAAALPTGLELNPRITASPALANFTSFSLMALTPVKITSTRTFSVDISSRDCLRPPAHLRAARS